MVKKRKKPNPAAAVGGYGITPEGKKITVAGAVARANMADFEAQDRIQRATATIPAPQPTPNVTRRTVPKTSAERFLSGELGGFGKPGHTTGQLSRSGAPMSETLRLRQQQRDRYWQSKGIPTQTEIDQQYQQDLADLKTREAKLDRYFKRSALEGQRRALTDTISVDGNKYPLAAKETGRQDQINDIDRQLAALDAQETYGDPDTERAALMGQKRALTETITVDGEKMPLSSDGAYAEQRLADINARLAELDNKTSAASSGVSQPTIISKAQITPTSAGSASEDMFQRPAVPVQPSIPTPTPTVTPPVTPQVEPQVAPAAMVAPPTAQRQTLRTEEKMRYAKAYVPKKMQRKQVRYQFRQLNLEEDFPQLDIADRAEVKKRQKAVESGKINPLDAEKRFNELLAARGPVYQARKSVASTIMSVDALMPMGDEGAIIGAMQKVLSDPAATDYLRKLSLEEKPTIAGQVLALMDATGMTVEQAVSHITADVREKRKAAAEKKRLADEDRATKAREKEESKRAKQTALDLKAQEKEDALKLSMKEKYDEERGELKERADAIKKELEGAGGLLAHLTRLQNRRTLQIAHKTDRESEKWKDLTTEIGELEKKIEAKRKKEAAARKKYYDYKMPLTPKEKISTGEESLDAGVRGGEEFYGPEGAAESPMGESIGGLPTISTDADFDALPSGTEFIAPDGTRRRKP